jgi:mono/diheme cytochrome c family protein
MKYVSLWMTMALLCGANTAVLAADDPSQWDGVYTEAQAARGKVQYEAICATCHGPTMGGGDRAPPLKGGEFAMKWDGFTLGELFDRIKSTMPESAPNSLKAPVVTDIVAYILQGGGYAPGAAELQPKMDAMDVYMFRAEKPAGG